MRPDLPALLRPTGVERLLLPDRTPVSVPKVQLILPRWRGAPPKHPLTGKPAVEVNEEAQFAEMAIRQWFEEAGWEARWLDAQAAGSELLLLKHWLDAPITEQVQEPIGSFAVRMRLKAIMEANGRAGYNGCWDVMAWAEGQPVFVKLKRKGKDLMRPTQIAWLDAGLRCGLGLDQFLLVEWDFIT